MSIADTLRTTKGAGTGCRRRDVEHRGRDAKDCREGAETLEYGIWKRLQLPQTRRQTARSQRSNQTSRSSDGSQVSSDAGRAIALRAGRRIEIGRGRSGRGRGHTCHDRACRGLGNTRTSGYSGSYPCSFDYSAYSRRRSGDTEGDPGAYFDAFLVLSHEVPCVLRCLGDVRDEIPAPKAERIRPIHRVVARVGVGLPGLLDQGVDG